MSICSPLWVGPYAGEIGRYGDDADRAGDQREDDPDTWTEAEVPLDDIAHSFAPGNRIGLSVSTVYWPIAWPSLRLAVPPPCHPDAGPGPVRPDLAAHHPPRATDATLRPFDAPESAPDTPSTAPPTPPKSPRKVSRDLLTGVTTADFPHWTHDLELTDIGQRMTSEGFARFQITGNDPLSALTEWAPCTVPTSLQVPQAARK